MNNLIVSGTLDNKSIENLLCMIDCVPQGKRTWNNDIICYHITDITNLESIKKDGLLMHSSVQSYNRPSCVYLFLDDVHCDNVPILLGNVDNFLLLTIKIPSVEIDNFKFDGLYNISFEHGYGAVMFFDNIPNEWIMSIDIK